MWWTQDDLFALGSPVTTNEEFMDVLTGKEHAFNCQCLQDYLDADTGKALLTSIPARYARTQWLARQYPRAKVAKIVRPFAMQRKKDSNGHDTTRGTP